MQEKGAFCKCREGYFTPQTSQEMGAAPPAYLPCRAAGRMPRVPAERKT